MSNRNEAWGIEVGQNAIKAVHLTRTDEAVEVSGWDVIRFKQVLTTPDLDVDEAIQVSLDKFLSKHEPRHARVVASVPGHLAFARFANLPPVEPKKIPDIVKFEAQQQIPFPIDEVEWDYQVFQQEDSPDVKVGIFAITKERVARFLANFNSVGLKVDALTLSPLAVYNAFAYENEEAGDHGEGTIYVDIGTVSTDVIIVEEESIWLRTLPIGGNSFTEALVKQFNISFSKAEKLKREAASSKHKRQLFQAMRPVFADFVQEVQRSLGYYQSMHRDAELKRLVGVGSTFRLPGLQKFLKQQLQIDVIRPDGYRRIEVEGPQQAAFSEHALNLATAYGLALQGLGLEDVSANILPQRLQRERLLKSKQPWIGGAAACLAVAAIAAGAVLFVENSTADQGVAQVEPRAMAVISQANRIAADAKAIDAEDPLQRTQNLQRMLDYRGVLPMALTDAKRAIAAVGRYTPVHAQSISATYLPPQPVSAVDGPAGVGGAPPAPAFGGGQPGGEIGVKHTTEEVFAEGARWPSIRITVTGEIKADPREATVLLTDHFVGHLRQVGGGPLPYTHDIKDPTAPGYVDPVGQPQPITPAGGTGFGGLGAPGERGPGGIGRPRQPGSEFGRVDEGRSGGAGEGGGAQLEAKIPVRDAARVGTWSRFEVTWTVRIGQPDVSRVDDAGADAAAGGRTSGRGGQEPTR